MDDTRTTETEPTEEEIREVLPNLICSTCDEERHILDFYDDEHTVNLTVADDDFGIVVDHGELALQKDRANL